MQKLPLLGLLFVGLLSPSISQAKPLDEVISPCLTPAAHRILKSADIYQQIDSLYAVDLLVSFGGTDYHALKIIQVDRDTCKTLFTDVYDRVEPISAVLPMDKARKFRLGWESRELERKGKANVQEWLLKHVRALSPESQWAYRELGFELRADIKTCPNETPQLLYCF